MALFRLAFLTLGGAALLSWVAWKLSGDEVWRQRVRKLLSWMVVCVLGMAGFWVLRRGAVFI